MTDFEMDFEWPLARYEIRQPEPLPTTGILGGINVGRFSPVALVPKGKPTRRRPAVKAFNKVAGLLAVTRPETLERNVLAAANVVGMLRAESQPGDVEPLTEWSELIAWIQVILGAEQIFVHNQSRAGFQVSQLGLFLVPGKDRKPHLAYKPTSLRDALVFHVARVSAAGTRINTCEACTSMFLTGGRRGQGKRIANSRFCCEQCRWDFNNARRKRA